MTKVQVMDALRDETLVETTEEYCKVFNRPCRIGKILNVVGALVTIETKDGPAGPFLFNEIQLFEKEGS